MKIKLLLFLHYFFTEVLADNGKGSFGRTMSLPFLLSAWGLGTAKGIVDIAQGNPVSELVLLLASIAAALYGGSKGISAIQKIKMNGHHEEAQKEQKNESTVDKQP